MFVGSPVGRKNFAEVPSPDPPLPEEPLLPPFDEEPDVRIPTCARGHFKLEVDCGLELIELDVC